MAESIEARAGVPGGAGTPEGESVVVRLEGGVLDVFTETASQRFHASMVTEARIDPSPAPTGEALVITALRQGTQIPARFEGEDRANLETILAELG